MENDINLQKNNIRERILGGARAQLGELPWQALLSTNPPSVYMVCGGAILNNQWLVSAAHCFHRGQNPFKSDLSISVGFLNWRKYEKDAPSIPINKNNIFIHPEYNFELNDIALIKLNKTLKFNENVRPIELLKAGSNFDSQTCVVCGWGLSKYGSHSARLLKVPLRILSESICKNTTSFFDPDLHICAKGRGNLEAGKCFANTGSSLACKVNGEYVLAGVVSSGKQPCGKYPDVFSRISANMNWINETITLNS